MIKIVIVGIGAVVIGWHLWEGRIHSGFIRAERAEAPLLYWAVIVAETLILIAIFRNV